MKVFRLFALALFSLIFASCEEMQDLKVIDVDSFFVNKLNSEGIEAEVKLKIENPNKMGFSIYPSTFDIIFNGVRLGKAKLAKRVHIDGKSERVYTFRVNSKLEDLNPLDLIRLLDIDNLGKVELKGDLKAGKLYMKKRFPVSYEDRIKILK